MFDYEEIVCGMPLSPRFKTSVENLLIGQNKTELRLPYQDKNSGKELLLFIKRGYVFGIMITWILQGICELKDYTEDMEQDGSIKKWLEVEIF